MSSGKIAPVNEIVLGPVQGLFNVNGSLIENVWWHERNYSGPINSKDVSKIWQSLREYEKTIFSRLSVSPFKDFVIPSLRRYVRALDGRDYESMYLKLWSLLEYLTQTTKDSYDVTIRRSAFLWDDPTFHREILQHLRDSRNTAVHHDSFTAEGETLIFQIKRYVEALLIFRISNPFKFKTKDDVRQFLDLPPDKDALRARRALMTYGLKFRDRKTKPTNNTAAPSS